MLGWRKVLCTAQLQSGSFCMIQDRHHARKSRASGYCYVADCVLALMTLRRPISPSTHAASPLQRPRVMYLDLDVHFSDGVAEAFYAPIRSGLPRVLVIFFLPFVRFCSIQNACSIDFVDTPRCPGLFPHFASQPASPWGGN